MTVVLTVDDDPGILRTLAINLRARGYEVERAADGRSALQALHEREPDLVLLDLGLPDLDGIEVLRRIREVSPVPVVVVSARREADDVVEALDLGADDYVTKPFDLEVLMARVRVAVRRGAAAPASTVVIETDEVRLDLGELQATRSGEEVKLTPTEWKLIEVLARQPGHLVRHAVLLHDVWGPGYDRETHYLRVYVAQLRRKLETDPARPRLLITEPGLGYRLMP